MPPMLQRHTGPPPPGPCRLRAPPRRIRGGGARGLQRPLLSCCSLCSRALRHPPLRRPSPSTSSPYILLPPHLLIARHRRLLFPETHPPALARSVPPSILPVARGHRSSLPSPHLRPPIQSDPPSICRRCVTCGTGDPWLRSCCSCWHHLQSLI
ncbi:hypothetical protein SEVIR_5G169800v4 [Setaria viridis]|uniref:Uncharacterized protein n=2 Tax=Setaria TaxID=4554 RepID=A0A368R5R5_SETIT|nr:hypothetical protein SETIT_5G170600v2 [Setaria italica]TKW14456.1 hypothetical protein SEVIR_5G169800v2 [Setaria viridis]TKW14457.1 hypothetical protein SEVIR_5G169800v2 [Setaria viridis]TKW14458.1 hypothetical protein SEVIR_5G169800v2 [Setaria viridis]